MSTATPPIDEELKILEAKLNSLKLAYEQYFLGSRPREPALLRSEVDRAVVLRSSQAIQNTALRFKFSSICSRYHAFKRNWDETLRRMEDGSYVRHRFKANLREREVQSRPPAAAAAPASGAGAASVNEGSRRLYEAFSAASERCGQGSAGLTPQRMDEIVKKQCAALREQFGADARFRFKVVVEEGKPKLKAARVAA